MTELYKVLFEMAVTVVVGVVLRQKRLLDERTHSTLTEILLSAILPFAIISSSQYEYSYEMLKGIIAVAGASVLYYLCTLIVLRGLTAKSKMEDSEKRVFVTLAVFANTSFVGIPIMQSLLGSSGILLAATYNLVYNLFFYTYGVHLISKKSHTPIQIIFNPVSAASVVSLILFVIPWRMPQFITHTIHTVGDMNIPLSMILLGSTLATVDVKKLFVDIKSYVVALLRLVVFPLLMLIAIMCVRKFVYISPVTMITLVVMTALPSGTMNAVYSEKHNCAPKFTARTVVLTLILMAITLPLLMSLSSRLFA
ncbi:MAG: AEC family transporter [Saccharofermentans sp.]|nr:AEC family transporter [Saccharofermentans sp.]